MADTLSLTYLGWQGWFIRYKNTAIMIDGLLVDRVGRGPLHTQLNFHFRRPRDCNWKACPPLNAYIVSHEHEDHFNVPSLARLDRSIPLIASARISSAARSILLEMGFSVRYAYPGEIIPVGDLQIHFFSPIHGFETDEWDTLGYFVHDSDRKVGFFSNVDIAITDEMSREVNRLTSAGSKIASFVGMQVSLWLMSEQEMSRDYHLAPKNADFVLDSKLALEVLKAGKMLKPSPGQTIELGLDSVSVQENTPFLRVSENPDVNRRSFIKGQNAEISAPAIGEPVFDHHNLSELQNALDDLARHLYGRALYQKLYSILSRPAIKNLSPTFVMILLTGPAGEELVYEYCPEGCCFKILDNPPEELESRYCGAVLMWANDFLALARGEIEPRTLGHSIDETWIFPEFSLWRIFWMFYHPQRFPQETLRQYRKQLSGEIHAEVLVKSSQA